VTVPETPGGYSARYLRLDIRNAASSSLEGSRGRRAEPISAQRTETGFPWKPLNSRARTKRGRFGKRL